MATDMFNQLETIDIGNNIDGQLLILGSKNSTLNNREVYTFPSAISSNPHIIYIEDDRVTFLQLTIPREKKEKYSQELVALGDPEFTLARAKSEIMLGYPSRGLGFIVNGYSDTVERVMKFTPKSSVVFIQEEGKNFQPVPYTQPDFVATPSTTSTPSASPITSYLANYWPYGVLLLTLVLLAMMYWFRIRRR